MFNIILINLHQKEKVNILYLEVGLCDWGEDYGSYKSGTIRLY